MNRDPKDWGGRPGRTPARRVTSDDASAEHRRKLEAMFSSGKVSVEAAAPAAPSGPPAGTPIATPDGAVRRTPSGKVFANARKSTGRQPSQFRLRLERLRMAREVEEIREAADQFLQHHQLPDDVDILYKVLLHPNEKVVRDAMGQISSLITQGRLGGTLILQDRLKDLSARATEPATHSYIQGLQSQLQKIAKP